MSAWRSFFGPPKLNLKFDGAPKLHPAQLPINDLLTECEVARTRGSGPGGQHRNKVETAIVLKHVPSGVLGQASEQRSQHRNREVAIERLRLNLAIAVRSQSNTAKPPPPSALWIGRRQAKKIVVSTSHEDYAALLAEALDQIAWSRFDVGGPAERLGVSTSQLIKFLKDCPAAFQFVNQQRQQAGLHRLK